MPGLRGIAWLTGVAAVLVVVVVVALAGSGDEPAPTAPSPTPTTPTTGAQYEPDPLPEAGQSADERAAISAARRFLEGYLPYSYGRASARRIRAVAAPLASTLRRRPPRRAADVRGLRPRVTGVLVLSANGDLGFDLQADVDDGRRRYSMIVAVRPTGRQWLVAALS